jgi:hypothetical protein
MIAVPLRTANWESNTELPVSKGTGATSKHGTCTDGAVGAFEVGRGACMWQTWPLRSAVDAPIVAPKLMPLICSG